MHAAPRDVRHRAVVEWNTHACNTVRHNKRPQVAPISHWPDVTEGDVKHFKYDVRRHRPDQRLSALPALFHGRQARRLPGRARYVSAGSARRALDRSARVRLRERAGPHARRLRRLLRLYPAAVGVSVTDRQAEGAMGRPPDPLAQVEAQAGRLSEYGVTSSW